MGLLNYYLPLYEGYSIPSPPRHKLLFLSLWFISTLFSDTCHLCCSSTEGNKVSEKYQTIVLEIIPHATIFFSRILIAYLLINGF
jgi:hypothetical protein